MAYNEDLGIRRKPFFIFINKHVFSVVVGVVGTVGNRNEFSGCPLMGVGKAVGKVPFFVHGLVHAHQRKQPLMLRMLYIFDYMTQTKD